MGQAVSAPRQTAPGDDKENEGEQRTLISLKRQRLNAGGEGKATATRRVTSDAAEQAPPGGAAALGTACNRLAAAAPGRVPPAAALPLRPEEQPQSESQRAIHEWVQQRLPAPAALREGEQRQAKLLIVKPLNMRPDYGAKTMQSGIRELIQNWLDRCYVLAAILGAGWQVHIEFWAPAPGALVTSLPAGCSAEALVARPPAGSSSSSGSHTASPVLLGYIAAFLDASGQLCYELRNCGTALSLGLLTLGSTSKGGSSSRAAGAFGDGMKTEANSLVAQGAVLTIRTSNCVWSFEHKELEDSSSLQLCVTSRAYQSCRPDTLVLVAGAQRCWFRREDFLQLQVPYECIRMEPEDQHQVSGIEVLTAPQFHGRVFMRGIFFQTSSNLMGMGLNYLGGASTFGILGIGRDRNHIALDKVVATLPVLAKHLHDAGQRAQHDRLLGLLYDQLQLSTGSNSGRYIWWYLGENHNGKVFKYTQGLVHTASELVAVFKQRHGDNAVPVGPGVEIKSEEFLQCKAVQVSSDLLAVLRYSKVCPSEEALLRQQVALLADPANNYDFSSNGATGLFMHEVQREVLASLTPHVNPSNLQFKQLTGNQRMVIPFDHRGRTVFAVDVNALSVQAVHAEAAKVGMAKACPATGCGCVRVALLGQLIEAVADKCKLSRIALQNAVMGRVLDGQALQGQPPALAQNQAAAAAGKRGSRVTTRSRAGRGAAGQPASGGHEAQMQMVSQLAARIHGSHLEGTDTCHRSGRGAPPQEEPPLCADNLKRTRHRLADGAAEFEAGSFLFAPFSQAAPSQQPQFHSLPTQRQLLMARKLYVLLDRLLRDGFSLPPRFFVYWHPNDPALAFNQGGALWFNAGHPRCTEVQRQGMLPWAEHTYLLVCHELAHNFERSHGTLFSDWMARIALRFRPGYERLRDAAGSGGLWEAVDAVSL